MNVNEERSRSLWMDLPPVEAPSLKRDLSTDVLVIGAGIAGLSTAYELALRGRQVTVVDRGQPARGMSARTSAHLASETDDYYRELFGVRGEEAARAWFESQSAAIDRIEQVCREEDIDCDFARIDGYLVPASEADVPGLREELAHSQAAGFTNAEWLERGPVPWSRLPAIRYPRQARFHPLRYLYGLVAALGARGVDVYGDTAVDGLEERDGLVVARTTDGRNVTARAVVVATNSPFHLKIPIHTKQAPYRTYVIAAQVPKAAVTDALVWDTVEPGYHYVRIQPGPDHDVLIVGGEDHKTGEDSNPSGHLDQLERWARAMYPAMGTVTHRWSGQVLEPSDYVPFIGRSPQHERVWLVTGDSGEGLTTGVVASLILAEQVTGGEHRWGELYDPSRKMLHGLREYLAENIDAARHWAAHLGGGEIDSVDELPAGHGAIARIDGTTVAAYRTPGGELKLHAAACTHAGCVVRWNGFERCWDCPCHGSQFSTDGEVLQGPAHRALEPFVPEKTTALRATASEREHRPSP